MRYSAILSALAISAAGACAQTISGGPISGAVFDSVTHSIRSIMGVPGAAYLGAAGAAAWDLAVPSPDGKMALALRGTDLSLIADLSNPDNATPLGATIETADRIVWSADSTTAAIYSSRSTNIQRITGLNATPALQSVLDLSSAGGAVAGWSLSPDGNSIAFSSGAAGSGSVYLSTADGAPVPVGSIADPGALAFSSDGGSLFVFDRASQKILRLELPSGAVEDSFTTDSAAGNTAAARAVTAMSRRMPPLKRMAEIDIEDMTALADGATLLAIGAQTLCAYDLSHQTPGSCAALEINPASIQAVGSDIFLLTYPRTSGSPIWLWDGRAGAVYFVPSGRSAANASN